MSSSWLDIHSDALGRYNEQISYGSADDWDVNIVWSQGSPSAQLVWQDGRSVCREEPERLRSLFALVFHRWWRGRSVREGGGSLPGNFYLPRTACTADAPSNRTCFRSQVVTLGIFSSLEFDRFRTRGEVGQGRLRADCYLALADFTNGTTSRWSKWQPACRF